MSGLSDSCFFGRDVLWVSRARSGCLTCCFARSCFLAFDAFAILLCRRRSSSSLFSASILSSFFWNLFFERKTGFTSSSVTPQDSKNFSYSGCSLACFRNQQISRGISYHPKEILVRINDSVFIWRTHVIPIPGCRGTGVVGSRGRNPILKRQIRTSMKQYFLRDCCQLSAKSNRRIFGHDVLQLKASIDVVPWTERPITARLYTRLNP